MRETRVRSLGWEDPLEKEMAVHSSILAWRIPWTEKPSRLQSTGSQRVGHNWATSPSPSPYEGKARFQSAVNVCYDRLVNGDSSVRAVGSLKVAGVPRALGLVSDVLRLECFWDTQGAMSNQAVEWQSGLKEDFKTGNRKFGNHQHTEYLSHEIRKFM